MLARQSRYQLTNDVAVLDVLVALKRVEVAAEVTHELSVGPTVGKVDH